MSGFSNPIVGGAATLIRAAIQSANFVAGVSGWQVTKLGAAEFNNATIRGSLIAGGGAVTINSTGLDIQGAGARYRIDSAAGFRGTLIPDNGVLTQLQSAVLILRPATPSPLNALVTLSGFVSADGYTVAGSVETPHLRLISPRFSVGGFSNELQVRGSSSGSTVDDSMVRIFSRVQDENLAQLISRTTNTGAIGAETVILQTAAYDWLANSAYQVTVKGRWQPANTTTPRANWNIRKTNAAGLTLSNLGRLTAISSEPYNVNLSTVFIVGTAPVNAVIVACLASGSAPGTNDVQMIASAGNPGTMEIKFLGPASAYSDYTTLV